MTTELPVWRSLMYVPVNVDKFIDKAHTRGADVIQLDLEDAVPIGPTEYRLLYFFMTHPERVYSRTQLLDHVWGGSVYVEERTVDVHIRRLRKTLEPWKLDEMVQTVRGTGYRFSVSA